MWRRIGRETWNCIRQCWKQLLLFEILYRTAWYTVFGALLRFGLQFALKQKDYSYLTAENFHKFVRYPGTIFIFACGLLFFLYTLLFELSALFTCYERQRSKKERISLGGMVQGGIWRSVKLLRRNPVSWIFGTGLLTPVLCGFYLVEESARIKFLNYFFQFLYKYIPNGVLGLLAAAALLAAFFCMLAIPETLRRGGSLKKQWGKSARLIWRNIPAVLFWMVFWQAMAILAATLTYILGSLGVATYVRIWEPQETALSVLVVEAERLQGFCGVMMGGLGMAFISSLLYGMTCCLGKSSRRLLPSAHVKAAWAKTSWWAHGAVAVMLALTLLAAWKTCFPQGNVEDILEKGTKVTAHRGAAKTAPENTMAAMENAVNKLSDYVEIDVQETKDGVLILLHDNNLKRTTGFSQDIWKVPYEVVECLDAGSWFKAEFKGEKIPRFEEVLEYCKGKILVNVEVKSNGHNEGIVEKVVAAIQECGMTEQCVLTSMNYQFLRQAKELEPELRTGYIMAMAYGNVELLEYADFLSVKYTYVTDEFVKKAHECGKEVHVWTVNSRYNLKRMIMLNVDNLITDRPELAVQVLAEEAGRETYLDLFRYMLRR